MDAPVERLRAELLAALAANSVRLCDALCRELARPISLEPGRPLQFEIDPFFYGISCCATEAAMFGDWLDAALPDDWFERTEQSLGGWHGIICDELCPWFADCWAAVGGPARFRPAYLFFHGYHGDQYDLEKRRWLMSAKAFGSA
jgi:hypothetical protein